MQISNYQPFYPKINLTKNIEQFNFHYQHEQMNALLF